MSQPNSSWWSSLWSAGADKRARSVQHIADDGTIADEMLAWTRDRLLPLTLLFSSVFCAIFYFKWFSNTVPPYLAAFAAVVIAIVIELGKVFFGIRAIRMLYFQGMGVLMRQFAYFVVWISTAAFAALTFYWSVSNSTQGLHELSLRTAYEASANKFTPDTRGIDAQISDARRAQERAASTRWKGTITQESQKAITREAASIEALQKQRTELIDQQRADFDRQQKHGDTQAVSTADWTRFVGGFIEAAQLLLLLIAASCEKILASRKSASKFPSGGIMNVAGDEYIVAKPMHNNDNNRRPIGFYHAPAPPDNTPPSPIVVPPGAILQQDGSIMFKHSQNMFKQVTDPSGNTVGLLYKGPRMAQWDSLGFPQVKSRLGIYQARAEKGEVSEALALALAQWEWAMGLFISNSDESTPNIKPIKTATNEP